jgi:hypothetical protein
VSVCEVSGALSPNHQPAHADARTPYQTSYTTRSLKMNPRGSKHVGDTDIKYKLENFAFLGFCFIIMSQCTVQKSLKKQ